MSNNYEPTIGYGVAVGDIIVDEAGNVRIPVSPLEDLRNKLGQLSVQPPGPGQIQEAIVLILKWVEAEKGAGVLLRWLLAYVGDASLTEVGMRIIGQNPSAQR